MEAYEGEVIPLRDDIQYTFIKVSGTDPFRHRLLRKGVHILEPASQGVRKRFNIAYFSPLKRRINDGIFKFRELSAYKVEVLDSECICTEEYVILEPIMRMSYSYKSFFLTLRIVFDKSFFRKFGNLEIFVDNSYFEIRKKSVNGPTWDLEIFIGTEDCKVELVMKSEAFFLRRTLKT